MPKTIPSNVVKAEKLRCKELHQWILREGPPGAMVHSALSLLEQGARYNNVVVALLKSAANQGSASAAIEYGNCFSEGVGVAKSPKNALHWYRYAHKLGEKMARVFLAIEYEKQKDFVSAARWYRKVTQAGFSEGRIHEARVFLLRGRYSKRTCKAALGYIVACTKKGRSSDRLTARMSLEDLNVHGF
jgi:TPR repeat protein